LLTIVELKNHSQE